MAAAGCPRLRKHRLGDLEALPIAEAWRIVKPGGRIAGLDLVKHRFEEARELYADLWLGFSEVELEGLLYKAGFANVQTDLVHKETEAPYFQTLLAVGDKLSGSPPE